MKKTVIKKELNLIEVFVKSSIQGIGIDALALKAGISKRTLQRRLDQLRKTKRIVTEGEGKNLKYILFPQKAQVQKSKASLEIENYLQRPIEERKIVGYNLDFLEDYIPKFIFQIPYKPLTILTKLSCCMPFVNIVSGLSAYSFFILGFTP